MNQKVYEQYAKLAVNVGINLQPNQEVVVSASCECAEFVEHIVKECYEKGARKVRVEWSQDKISRLHMQYQTEEVMSEVLPWEEEKMKHMTQVIPCRIYVDDSDPDVFAGLDMKKVSNSRVARYKVMKKYIDQMENKDQWTIIAVPSPSWATKVFPELDEKEAVEKLWEAIMKTTRLDQGDAVEAWEKHIAYLKEKSEKMNALNLDYLTYKASNGTDLRIKLQPHHVWLSARETSLQGIEFSANMPTEEVFTMPKRDGVDGVVYSTKPLSLQGQLVENFKFTFEKGKIVKVEAEKGLDVLETTLDMDESSRYLGEVALVPFNSPINETGILFSNTLFDENACCHLAFGAAFKNNIKGYETMSEEDFKEVGFNDSVNHVDFMIGSEDLEILGYDFDGKEHVIFKNGIWAI